MREEQDPGRCDFFVSYTGVDTAWAEWIAWQLKEAGYMVTIQAWHFRPGSNFVALMRQALDRCQRIVAVISQAYLDQSTYGSDEWTAAFTHHDPISSSLLLVLVEPVSLPRLLRPWININLTGLEPKQAAVRLLNGVRPGPAEPTKAPAFPGRVGPGPGAGAGPRYPGHHPEIANLPARNAAFAGRDDQLDELRERLHQQGAAVAVVPAQALYGLGGVGKTQLALEYAHRYQADYELIWWIVAETPGAIPAGLAALATSSYRRSTDKSPRRRVNAPGPATESKLRCNPSVTASFIHPNFAAATPRAAARAVPTRGSSRLIRAWTRYATATEATRSAGRSSARAPAVYGAAGR